MKIFLAWSGEASKATAIALRDWLPYILQNAEPFMSEEDIRKGARWRQEISKQLSTVSFAILCLTRDNLKSPWLHFEAGAIATRAETNQVSALLLGVENQDVVDPLKEFQHTSATKKDILKLVSDLNTLMPSGKVEERRLAATFEKFWPELESQLQKALTMTDRKAVSKRTQEELLDEILENTRTQGRNMSLSLEMQSKLLSASSLRSAVNFGSGGLGSPTSGLLGGGVLGGGVLGGGVLGGGVLGGGLLGGGLAHSAAGATPAPLFGGLDVPGRFAETAREFFEKQDAQQRKIAKMIERLDSNTVAGTIKPKNDAGKK
jgi:hypothetical protein